MVLRPYLHSTMYLLNQLSHVKTGSEEVSFTFHYVSIKSTDAEENHIHGNIFTFHYVSIKSGAWR